MHPPTQPPAALTDLEAHSPISWNSIAEQPTDRHQCNHRVEVPSEGHDAPSAATTSQCAIDLLNGWFGGLMTGPSERVLIAGPGDAATRPAQASTVNQSNHQQ